MNEHRVSVLSSTLRRYEDPTRSKDPRVVSLLEELRNVPAPEPRAHFRAELRAQLVAVAPRIVAEGMTEGDAMVDIVPRPTPAQLRGAITGRPSPRPRPVAEPATVAVSDDAPAGRRSADTTDPTFWQKVRAVPIGRPLAVAASVVALLALVLGGAVWMSQKALPGDSLYGVKRAAEGFELATASNDTERAQDHLDFAATRVHEARELLQRDSASASGTGLVAGGISEHTQQLIAGALSDANTDTRAASRLLGNAAVQSYSAGPLAAITSWAPQQLKSLGELSAALPQGTPLQSQAAASTTVVHEAAQRATSLESRVDNTCMENAPSDRFGPKPCANPAVVTPKPTAPKTHPAPVTSAPTTQPPAQHGTTPAPPASSSHPVVTPTQPRLTNPASRTTPAAPTAPVSPPSLPIKLPTTLSPTQPLISVGPSCISIIGIGLGNC